MCSRKLTSTFRLMCWPSGVFTFLRTGELQDCRAKHVLNVLNRFRNIEYLKSFLEDPFVYKSSCIYAVMHFYSSKLLLHSDWHAKRKACLFSWLIACVCVYVYDCIHTKKESWRQKWLCYFVVVLVSFTEARTKVTQASKNTLIHSDQI